MTHVGLIPRFRPARCSAAETALALLLESPEGAQGQAIRMFKIAADGLDIDLIEHWARVVMEVGRMAETQIQNR